MKRTSLFLLVFLFATAAHAELSLNIPARIERSITSNEPKWKLVFVSIRKTSEENYSYFRWKYGADEVAVQINEYESALRITRVSISTAAARKIEALNGFGDEAYLLGPTDYPPKKFDIIFRKGKVRVNVSAASEELARQFAKDCARALPAAG